MKKKSTSFILLSMQVEFITHTDTINVQLSDSHTGYQQLENISTDHEEEAFHPLQQIHGWLQEGEALAQKVPHSPLEPHQSPNHGGRQKRRTTIMDRHLV